VNDTTVLGSGIRSSLGSWKSSRVRRQFVPFLAEQNIDDLSIFTLIFPWKLDMKTKIFFDEKVRRDLIRKFAGGLTWFDLGLNAYTFETYPPLHSFWGPSNDINQFSLYSEQHF
jgi:hypothetical protein